MSSLFRTKKSLIALLVGAPLTLSLVACGSSEETDGTAGTDRSTVTSTTAGDKPEESDSTEVSEEPDTAESPDEPKKSGQADAVEKSGSEDEDSEAEDTASEDVTADGTGQSTDEKAAEAPEGSDTAPQGGAEETTGDPAVTAEVEAAVRNQFDGAHYANMATLWDHTQRSTCASALTASQQEAKEVMAQELPAEMQGLDVFALMDDPNVGPLVREELANQPAPAAPTLNSIDSINVDGGQATVQVNSTTEGQSEDQTLTFVNEGGAWKACA